LFAGAVARNRREPAATAGCRSGRRARGAVRAAARSIVKKDELESGTGQLRFQTRPPARERENERGNGESGAHSELEVDDDCSLARPLARWLVIGPATSKISGMRRPPADLTLIGCSGFCRMTPPSTGGAARPPITERCRQCRQCKPSLPGSNPVSMLCDCLYVQVPTVPMLLDAKPDRKHRR